MIFRSCFSITVITFLITHLLIISVIIYNFDFLTNNQESNIPNKSPSKLSSKCSIDDGQAISALHRMKTEQCKKQLLNVFCSIKQRDPFTGSNLWPDVLHSKCQHFDQNNHRKLIKCHKDIYSEQLSSLFTSNIKKSTKALQTNNWRDCVDLCLQIDFQYAYFHSSSYECVCTNNLDTTFIHNSSSFSSFKSNCDLQCFINTNYCPDYLFIYSTGNKKISYYLPSLDIINNYDVNEDFKRPKIVFLLLVSGRAVNQVNRLIRNIYQAWHYYYIHVDSRDEYLFEQLLHLETKFPSNVKLHRKRFNSIWGGASLLTCILDCLQNILQIWPDWDFVLNLSETDFPIKPIDSLERYLAKNIGKNFIKSHGKNTYDFIQTQALNKTFIQCERHMWRIADRYLPKGIVWDGGSDWIILNRNFSHYLIHSEDELLKSLMNYFKYALLPAESFFHVVLRNSEHCSSIVNNNLRATNWNRKKGCRCQQKNVVDWCGCSPNVFRIKDLPRLRATQTKPLFFARKFEHVIDTEVIDLIELRFLLNNHQLEHLNDNYYMLNIYHYKFDHKPSLPKMHFYLHFGKKALQSLMIDDGEENIPKIEALNLLETNLLFQNNKHYGTLLRFEYLKQEQTIFEVLLRKHSNDTLLFTGSNIRPKLKTLKICSHFDEKEDMFRNFECLITVPDIQNDDEPLFQILHEWRIFYGQFNITFLVLDPENRLAKKIDSISLSNNDHQNDDQDHIAMLYHYYNNHNYQLTPPYGGIWKLVVLNQDQMVLGMHRFLILASPNTTPPKQYSSSTATNNIIIENLINKHPGFFIQNPNDSGYEQLWFMEDVCVYGGIVPRNCDNAIWSSHNQALRLGV